MTTELQPHTNTIITAPTVPLLPATTLTRPATVETPKLSRAQVRCLETMEYGTRPLPLSAKSETQRMNKLIKMGLVDSNHGLYCPEYFLTLDGKETLRALNGQLPPVETVETVATVSTETPAVTEKSNPFSVGDRVSTMMSVHFGNATVTRVLGHWVDIRYDDGSKTSMGWAYLTLIPPAVNEETPAAPQAYAVGDTVSFHYALSNIDGNLYTGIIKSPVKRSELWGDVVLIEPLVNAYHLPPRHVSVERIVAVIATAPVIDAPQPAAQASGACVVPYLTGMDTLRAILDLSNEATQAELDGRMSEARAISKEHTRLYDAYMKALKAESDKWKPAPQSRHDAVSAPSATMQDTTREMVANPPQIEADASPRLFAPHMPLPTDRAILAAKRQAQHDAAQARIKAGQPAPQIAPQRPTAAVSAAPVIVKPRSAMNAAQQASEDGLQALIASSRSLGKAE